MTLLSVTDKPAEEEPNEQIFFIFLLISNRMVKSGLK